MSKKKNKQNIGCNNSTVHGNHNKIENTQKFNKSNNNNIDKSKTIIKDSGNIYSPEKFIKDDVHKYDSVDRLGIYHRVGEIITCDVILLDQVRKTKNGDILNVVANVIENGKLIADHLHVDFGNYIPTSNRIQITGEVYPYGQGNNKRGIKIIEEPYCPNDTFKIYGEPYSYIDIKQQDYEYINSCLNQMDKQTLCDMISSFRKIINDLSESRLGKDTIYNYALTQITLNSNNNIIYSDQLSKLTKNMLIFIILLLSNIIYDLTTLMNKPEYTFEINDNYKFAEINIIEIFKNISIICNCLQGLNGTYGTKNISEGFKWFCKELKIEPNKAYAHTVKHRYTNFEITEDDEINIMTEKHPYAVILRYIGYFIKR